MIKAKARLPISCMITQDETSHHQTDQIENRPLVHKLAAATADKMSSVFLSHTYSQKTHVLLRHLKTYLDSPEALNDVAREIGVDVSDLETKELDKLHEYIISSSCCFIVRAWANIGSFWLHYICHSSKKLVGTIYCMFVRTELQGPTKPAQNDRQKSVPRPITLPHAHLILWCQEARKKHKKSECNIN